MLSPNSPFPVIWYEKHLSQINVISIVEVYFCGKIRRVIARADFQARSKRYISCDQYRRTCLNLQPDPSVVLKCSRATEFANSICTVVLRASRSSRFYLSSLLRYLTMWLRFGIITLAVRSFERCAMSHRSVISKIHAMIDRYLCIIIYRT